MWCEVFLIAGQSYATNCNDERLQVADRTGRVVAYDSRNGTWNIAHDPQPAGDSSDGGSIWPPLEIFWYTLTASPVGLANVAVGGTSTSQWRTDGELFQRLETVGRQTKGLSGSAMATRGIGRHRENSIDCLH